MPQCPLLKKTLPTQLENSLIMSDLHWFVKSSNLPYHPDLDELFSGFWGNIFWEIKSSRRSWNSSRPTAWTQNKNKKKLQCQCGGWRSKYRPCDSWSSFHSFHLCLVFWGKNVSNFWWLSPLRSTSSLEILSVPIPQVLDCFRISEGWKNPKPSNKSMAIGLAWRASRTSVGPRTFDILRRWKGRLEIEMRHKLTFQTRLENQQNQIHTVT